MYDFDVVNCLKKYLLLDFAELRYNAVIEQQLIKNLYPDERCTKKESTLVSNIEDMVTVEFEWICVKRWLHLVSKETLWIWVRY